MSDFSQDTPVVMVGNKIDQAGDRMVSTEEGQRRSKEIGCVCFQEISVRESIEQVWSVFRDARRFWRVSKWSRGRSEEARAVVLGRPLLTSRTSSDSIDSATATSNSYCGSKWTEADLEEQDQVSIIRSDSTSSSSKSECGEEFRARASTDSRLPPRPSRARHPSPTPIPPLIRRMSVAMKGNNTTNY